MFLLMVLFGLALMLMRGEKRASTPPPSVATAEKIIQKVVAPAVDHPVEKPEKTDVAELVETPPPPPAPPKVERFYEIKGGECLWEIAARPDVYNDPEMWRVLYRANPEIMDYYYQKGGAPFVIINPGVRLRIPEPQEVRTLQRAVPEKLWVLQLSANRKLHFALMFAGKLKGLGNVVYVMEDLSKGQPWYLVRMGFFTHKEKARAAADDVARQTGHSEYIIRRASRNEIEAHLPFPSMGRGSEETKDDSPVTDHM
ncbi:MAG: SPOR domain-containing protein [Deltaproteobacteria bacterium]|nr:SPOR domain-containing protein [Deltaproteobacteria bacterium]